MAYSEAKGRGGGSPLDNRRYAIVVFQAAFCLDEAA